MTIAAATARSEETGRAGIFSWMLFDWAQQPFFTLITTFIFAPWFASEIASSEAEGQSLWALTMGISGALIALLSPALGAVADAAGRIKFWMAGFSLMLVAGCSALWMTAPDTIGLVLAAVVLATVGAEFGIVFTNALMPRLVPRERIGRLSGRGWALGYAGGLLSLILALFLLIPDRDTGLTLIGFQPVLSDGHHWIGPLSALWFVVFSLPFFLFTPTENDGRPLGVAIGEGLGRLEQSLRGLKGPLFQFLLARMFYQDGLNALFAFGGIYAAGTFGWQTTEIGLFGILLVVTGALGAWLGGWLDDRFGAKLVIAGSLALLFVAATLILSVDRDHVLFVMPLAEGTGDGLFSSPAERIYVALGLLVGLVSGPMQAASRTLLIRLARPEEMTQAFGLFALSGRVTAFAAPMTIAWLTWGSGSQRIGISALLVFLFLGLVLLLAVRTDAARD